MSNPIDAPSSEHAPRANSPKIETETSGADGLVGKMDIDVEAGQENDTADAHGSEESGSPKDQSTVERRDSQCGAGAEKLSNNKLVSQVSYRSQYNPQDDDFTPDPSHIRSTDPSSLEYWEGVLSLCVPETRLNTPRHGQRDTFGVGSLVIKCDHNNSEPAGNYSFFDENEEAAVGLVAEALQDIKVPEYYLRAEIGGRDIVVRSRIPGVSLDSVWPSLTLEQKLNYKKQAQEVARRLHLLKSKTSKPSYLVDIDQREESLKPRLEERDILFSSDPPQDDVLGLSHNNLLPSNIIVDNDTIVGIVGWSHAGYFGLDKSGQVHRDLRCKDGNGNPIPELWEEGAPWYDLYDTVRDEGKSVAIHTKNGSQPPVKAEEPVPDINAVPPAARGEAFGFPTPRKITDLKQESVSRASSLDRSSPAPSTKAATKKRAPAVAKKGQATRKPAAKKRKLNDTESVDGTTGSRRSSATPSVRGAKGSARRSRKQTSVSIAGSPAPEDNARGKSQEVEDEMEEDEDDGQLFCICRRPDNHTWMIACDGGCDDWFHGKCVNMKQADADLIDKYICPNCEKKQGIRTTWKRMCRLPGCRQPARVTAKTPSKYCSDEHGVEFMRRKLPAAAPRSAPPTREVAGLRSGTITRESSIKPGRQKDAETGDENAGDEEGPQDGYDTRTEREGTDDFNKGGVLTPREVKALVDGVSSAEEFRKLGESLLISEAQELKPLREVAESFSMKSEVPSKGVDFDSLADNIEWMPEERRQMDLLKEQRNELLNRSFLLNDRDKFVGLVRQRAKTILERLRQNDPKGWKDICGFDSRLSWSDEEFDEWRQSESGKKALEDGVLEAGHQPVEDDGTGDTEMVDAEADADKTGGVGAGEVESIAQGVCIKKRCEQHRQWVKVQQQDIQFEQTMVKEQLAKCEKRATEVIEGVVLRAYGDQAQAT